MLLRLSCSFVVDRPFLILQLKTQLASVELPDNFPPAPFGGARFFVRSSTRFNFVSDLNPNPSLLPGLVQERQFRCRQGLLPRLPSRVWCIWRQALQCRN